MIIIDKIKNGWNNYLIFINSYVSIKFFIVTKKYIVEVLVKFVLFSQCIGI